MGCDYLEPIKGVGPKSALKLVREHGGLAGVVEHLRAKQAEKEEAIAAAEAEEESADEPAATSDVEAPDGDEDEDDEAKEKKEKPKPKPKKKAKGKARGGVQIPEEWPWEEAKKLFLTPDVIPADEVEVRKGRS